MNANTWAMLCHLSGLTGYVANGLGSIIVPLILWLIKKDEMPAVDQHGREALNFNLSILIYGLVLSILTFFTFGLAMFVTIPLFLALVLFHVICVILAAIKAMNGEEYRYPLSLRLVK